MIYLNLLFWIILNKLATNKLITNQVSSNTTNKKKLSLYLPEVTDDLIKLINGMRKINQQDWMIMSKTCVSYMAEPTPEIINK
jgi:hypothetical protein